MSLFDALRNLLPRRAPPPSTLRNKPGGLARVRILTDDGSGAAAMNGCFVTTVRLDGDSFWVLDPPLPFTVQVFTVTRSGRAALPGDVLIVESMHDDLLEPIRDIGQDERSEETTFQPTVPAVEPGRVPA